MNITIIGEDEDGSIHDLILITILAGLMELRKTIKWQVGYILFYT